MSNLGLLLSRPTGVRSDRKPSLHDPIEVNFRKWEERATMHARDAIGDHTLGRFRAGEDALHIGAEMRRPM
jgi:hypothetical protein